MKTQLPSPSTEAATLALPSPNISLTRLTALYASAQAKLSSTTSDGQFTGFHNLSADEQMAYLVFTTV